MNFKVWYIKKMFNVGSLISEPTTEVGEIHPNRSTKGKRTEVNEANFTVDRDLSTLEVQTLSSEGDGWIKLEFDKAYFFYEVIVYYWFFTNWYKPTEWCVLSEANFRACVDSGH